MDSVIALILARGKCDPHLFFCKLRAGIAVGHATIRSAPCYLSRVSWRHWQPTRSSLVANKGHLTRVMTSFLLVFFSFTSRAFLLPARRSEWVYVEILIDFATLLLIRPKENLRHIIFKLSTLQLLLFVRLQETLQLPFKLTVRWKQRAC